MWIDAIINIIFNFIIKIKNFILKNAFTFLLIAFIYNFLLIYIEIWIYHIITGAYLITNTLGFTSSQIYFLFFLFVMPDILAIFKKVLNKVI